MWGLYCLKCHWLQGTPEIQAAAVWLLKSGLCLHLNMCLWWSNHKCTGLTTRLNATRTNLVIRSLRPHSVMHMATENLTSNQQQSRPPGASADTCPLSCSKVTNDSEISWVNLMIFAVTFAAAYALAGSHDFQSWKFAVVFTQHNFLSLWFAHKLRIYFSLL